MNEKTPAKPADTPLGERLAGGLLAGHDAALESVAEAMLKDAPKATRFVLKKIPSAPGFRYDLATLATSDNKARTLAGVVGGMAGGAVGGLAGPLGAAGGSMAGEAGAEWLYDHPDEPRRKAEQISQWMKDRAAHFAGRATHFAGRATHAAGLATHAFDAGLPPYSPRLN